MSDRITPRRFASRLPALALGAALVAALLVPMIVLVLAGASFDSQSIDSQAAGDAAGTASAAVGGAQRLLTGGRSPVHVELPLMSCSVLAPIGACAATHGAFERSSRFPGPGFAAIAAAQSRRF